MDPERWKQIDSLLHAALARRPEERDAFLRQACGDDRALESETRALLAAQDQAGTFLNEPALDVAARSLARDDSTRTQGGTDELIGRTLSHYRVVAKLPDLDRIVAMGSALPQA